MSATAKTIGAMFAPEQRLQELVSLLNLRDVEQSRRIKRRRRHDQQRRIDQERPVQGDDRVQSVESDSTPDTGRRVPDSFGTARVQNAVEIVRHHRRAQDADCQIERAGAGETGHQSRDNRLPGGLREEHLNPQAHADRAISVTMNASMIRIPRECSKSNTNVSAAVMNTAIRSGIPNKS